MREMAMENGDENLKNRSITRSMILRSIRRDLDLNLNGNSSIRLTKERENLLRDENLFKKKLESIANYRRTEFIPIGKLQRALDESDREEEEVMVRLSQSEVQQQMTIAQQTLEQQQQSDTADQMNVGLETNDDRGPTTWRRRRERVQTVSSNSSTNPTADQPERFDNNLTYDQYPGGSNHSQLRFQQDGETFDEDYEEQGEGEIDLDDQVEDLDQEEDESFVDSTAN
ncbi:hypothetical protein BY996DRAFT_280937 [Phakopsora pachyrhizi]|nr:hypothetical protein BY996DRAFT_280937 [Phakopsora pachyrhizi]